MNIHETKVKNFLNQKTIAVAGVSWNPAKGVGNYIYKKLKNGGYNVIPINPLAQVIDGDRCYPNLKSAPGKIAAILITTNPGDSLEVMKQCIDEGIKHVWIHRSFGNGSYLKEAADMGDAAGISVIRIGCPMMYIKGADMGHKFFRFYMRITGKFS